MMSTPQTIWSGIKQESGHWKTGFTLAGYDLQVLLNTVSREVIFPLIKDSVLYMVILQGRTTKRDCDGKA